MPARLPWPRAREAVGGRRVRPVRGRAGEVGARRAESGGQRAGAPDSSVELEHAARSQRGGAG
jgi:hypothetical protein